MILVFIVQYFIISLIKVDSTSDINNNLNKIYLSSISALIVGFIYVLMIDFKQGSLNDCNYYIGFGIGIGILVYAYRNQIGITDYDWSTSMIENLSNGLMISKKFSQQKSTNENQNKCIEFSKYIIKSNQEQIDLFNKLISDSNTRGLFY